MSDINVEIAENNQVSKPGLSVRPTRSIAKLQSFRPNVAGTPSLKTTNASRKPMALPEKKVVTREKTELENKLAAFLAEKKLS